MKRFYLLFSVLIIFAFVGVHGQNTKAGIQTADSINSVLDAFHKAAADANFEAYFSYFAEDAVFMGTDASERWPVKDFKVWCKPYFDRGKAWHFTALQRHVTVDASGQLAWFDELLDTQMKICRGSGVLVKQGGMWKVSQYVLSMTIPNEKSDSVIRIKAPLEEEIIEYLRGRKG